MAKPDPERVEFTAAETKFVLAMLRNVQGNIQFDKLAVARELSMKDAASVSARWNTILRTKIQANRATKATSPTKGKSVAGDDVDDDTPTKAAKTKGPSSNGIKKTSTKKRGKAKAEPGDSDPESPSKIARKDSLVGGGRDMTIDSDATTVKLEDEMDMFT